MSANSCEVGQPGTAREAKARPQRVRRAVTIKVCKNEGLLGEGRVGSFNPKRQLCTRKAISKALVSSMSL